MQAVQTVLLTVIVPLAGTYSIYALADPRTGEVRYVGMTRNPSRRFRQHNRSVGKGIAHHRACWIGALLGIGLRPHGAVLEVVSEGMWREAERRWIAYYRSMGADLTNGNGGGEGNCDPSDETRAKLRAAGTGRKHTSETRAKMSAAHMGSTQPPNVRLKIGAYQTGLARSSETRERMSAALKGRTFSPEARAKMSASARNRPPISEATRAKLAVASANCSLETRAKISAAGKGRRNTAETRAKMSAAATARYARLREAQKGE